MPSCCMPDEASVIAFASMFKALSDRTRQRILFLLEERPRTVTEIVAAFSLSQSTISRHLAVLRNAGLVEDRRQGQHVIYSVRHDRLRSCCEGFFHSFRSCIEFFQKGAHGRQRRGQGARV